MPLSSPSNIPCKIILTMCYLGIGGTNKYNTIQYNTIQYNREAKIKFKFFSGINSFFLSGCGQHVAKRQSFSVKNFVHTILGFFWELVQAIQNDKNFFLITQVLEGLGILWFFSLRSSGRSCSKISSTTSSIMSLHLSKNTSLKLGKLRDLSPFAQS